MKNQLLTYLCEQSALNKNRHPNCVPYAVIYRKFGEVMPELKELVKAKKIIVFDSVNDDMIALYGDNPSYKPNI